MLSTGGDLAPLPTHGILGSIWRRFWLDSLKEECYWCLVGWARSPVTDFAIPSMAPTTKAYLHPNVNTRQVEKHPQVGCHLAQMRCPRELRWLRWLGLLSVQEGSLGFFTCRERFLEVLEYKFQQTNSFLTSAYLLKSN